MKHQNYWKKLVSFALILLLVLMVLYGGFHFLEENVLYSGTEADPVFPSRTITRDGIDYYPRRDITVMLLLGIGPEHAAADGKTGQTTLDDALLLVFDETNEIWNMLQLSCDTVMDIPVPGEAGGRSGTTLDRLAQAYTYGSGAEERCLNTRRAVSDFLSGIGINYYIAVEVDAVSVLRDSQDWTLEHLEDVYSAAQHLVTDCPIQNLISLAARYQDYHFSGIITPEGEHIAGDGSDQFHADETKLEELVIQLFYAPKSGQ